MNIPTNLRYTRTHEWVQTIDDNTVRIGLTDFAQDALGDLVFVTLPGIGDPVSAGASLGDVESVKSVSEIDSPCSGTVVAANQAVVDAPEKINADPYGSWLVEVNQITGWVEILDAAAYGEFCDQEH